MKCHFEESLLHNKGKVVGYERMSYHLILLGGNMLMISCCDLGTCGVCVCVYIYIYIVM